MKRFSGDLDAALVAVYALVAPVLFIPGLVDLYVLPRTSLAVLFAGVLGGAGVYRAWRDEAAAREALWPLRWASSAVVAAAIVAAVFSINPWLSIAGAYTRYESVVLRIAYLALFLGAAVLLAGRERRTGRRLVAGAFVAGSTIAAGEASWQLLTHSLARPDGNLGQANLLGALLAMALPLSLQAGFRFWPALATLPVLCFGLYASSSRSGWLAALVGCLVVLVVVVPARSRRPATVAAGLVLAGAAAVILLSPLRNLNSDTGSARVGVWGDGVRMIEARPLTGWGEDATGLVFGRFQSANWEPGNTFDRIHDQPLDLLAAQGVLGFAACAWFWGLVAWWSVGAARREPGGAQSLPLGSALGTLVAYSAWSLLNFDWAPATAPFWVLGGVAWTEVRARLPAPARPDPGAAVRSSVSAARATAGLVVLAAAFVALPPLAADRAYYTGDDGRASRLNPLQAQYARALGDALGHTAGGLAELERARDLGEYDYRFFIELGDLARDLERVDEARAAYTRAEQIYRFDPTAAGRLRSLGTS